ncbi:MAG TPA: IclR family transcriptional regulator [Candidatus Limnocylindrales bacterium]|nr:IclR family transcriptional regulator [Candidatus Limnocylindrales bacterium]
MPNSLRPSHEATPAQGRQEGILVLNKVRAILDAFANDVTRAGPSEVAARIGANKSTTYRLLTSMERTGLLDRFPDGTFGLGLWLMELGSVVESRLDLRAIAEPELRTLRDATGLTAFLTVRHGRQATCISRLAGSNVDVLALRLGGVLPLYCGAGPRVLLASLSAEELEGYLAEAPFPPLTPHTLTAAEALRADAGRSRVSGYVVSLEDVTVGVGALGAPVRDASGDVIAAVSVAGLKHEFEGQALVKLAGRVRSTADRVSAAMGRKAPNADPGSPVSPGPAAG